MIPNRYFFTNKTVGSEKMGYLAKRKSEERERWLLIGLLMLLPSVTLLGTLGRSLDWQMDYLGEFKVQGAMLGAVLSLWCLFKKHWYGASLFFALAVLNLALVSSQYHLTERPSVLPENAHSFKILYQDLKGADKEADAVRNVLDSSDADVVLWTNVPVDLYRNLNEIKGAYSLQNQTLDKHGKMMLIMARVPSTARGEINGAGLWVSRVVGTRKLTLALTSLDPWAEDKYDDALEKVARLSEFSRNRDEPVVLVGGFGAAGWSWLLNSLETEAGLSPKGKVVLTYPANLPVFLRRPTDHVYTHPGIEVSDLETTPDIGTKHLGLTATVRIAPEIREVEFYDLTPVIPEEELLQDPL